MADPDLRDDSALVEAANRGDAAAFEALYRRYRDWVVRLAFRFTGNREDALDVLQDAFAYLLRKLPRLRLTAAMTTFLYPVVKNLSIGILRKRRRHTDSEEAIEQLAAPPAQDLEASRAELATVLARLPEPQRETLLMRFVDGMTLDEIAQALDIPLGTVKSRLHNTLASLRNDERTKRYFRQENA